MRLLITGAFGNIGRAIVEEALKRNHRVTVFEKTSPMAKKMARKYHKKVKHVIFDDIRNKEMVLKAMSDQDGVIHLAGIIPPLSELNEKLCHSVNIEGTNNIIEAIKQQKTRVSLVMASTVTVTGNTQDSTIPVNEYTPYHGVNNYNKSKIQCEQNIRSAGLASYCITRLGAVMPTISKYRLKTMKYGFEIPYDSRVEMITDKDVAVAQLNAVEKLYFDQIESGNIYLLGGGVHCRTQYGELIGGFFQALGLKPPEKALFTLKESFLDWMDTKKAEKDLNFQHDHLKDYYGMLKKQYRILLPLIFLTKKWVRIILIKQSAYYQTKRRRVAYAKSHV